MTKREQALAAIVGVLVLGVGAWWGWDEYRQALNSRSSARDSRARALGVARTVEKEVKRAAIETLTGYQERSLPADPQTAQRDYRAWLVGSLEQAGLDFEGVNFKGSRQAGEAYTSFGYTINAEGDLAAATRFLHAFYSSPLLHKLTRLSITPLEKGGLKLAFDAEALAVGGADRKSGVPAAPSGRPRLGGVDAYLASITGRDVFREYVPPRPPPPPRAPRPVAKKPPPKPKFDDAAHAYVTGIVQAGDRLQAWITVRTTGEVLRLFAGDELRVGLLEGSIESVSARQIVVRSDGKRFATPLGANLREGEPLAGEPSVF